MNTLFLAIPLFLLFSFAPKPSSSSSATIDDPVFDINDNLLPDNECRLPCSSEVKDHKGDLLQPDNYNYYILSATGSKEHRGLTPSLDDQKCIVIPTDSNNNHGMALKFSAETSDPCKLRITFKETIGDCEGKTVWEDGEHVHKHSSTRYLKLSTSTSTSSSWVQFVNVQGKNAYRIVYFKNHNLCFNVSYDADEPKFLVLSKDEFEPLVVHFLKVGGANEKPFNPDLENISTEMPTIPPVP